MKNKKELITELAIESFKYEWDAIFPHTPYENIVEGESHMTFAAQDMLSKHYDKIEKIINKHLGE